MPELNAGLEKFNTFIRTTEASNDTAVQMSASGDVEIAKPTSSLLGRKLKITDASKNDVNINNTVRNQLVKALKEQFNVQTFNELPDSVKKALKGSHAMTAEGDFKFDANGVAQSGKPLTKRRVQAVLNAAKIEISKRNFDEIFVDMKDGYDSEVNPASPDVIKERLRDSKEIKVNLNKRITSIFDAFLDLDDKELNNIKTIVYNFVDNSLVKMGSNEQYSFSELCKKLCYELSKIILKENKTAIEIYKLNDFFQTSDDTQTHINFYSRIRTCMVEVLDQYDEDTDNANCTYLD